MDENTTVFPKSPAAAFLHELNRRYVGLQANVNADDQARIALHERYKVISDLLERLNASLYGDYGRVEQQIRMSAVEREMANLAVAIDQMDARFVARRKEMHDMHVFCTKEALAKRPAGSGPIAALGDCPGIMVDTRSVLSPDDVSYLDDSSPFGSLLIVSNL